MGVRQAAWNQATQERIAATSAVLSSIKSIKIMGFAKYIFSDIQALRDNEIQQSRRFRQFTVVLNFLGIHYVSYIQMAGWSLIDDLHYRKPAILLGACGYVCRLYCTPSKPVYHQQSIHVPYADLFT